MSICEICGRLFSARRFCGFCVFRGRFLSEAMLVQRRPLHPQILPCYNNKIATLQQQDCHATTIRLPRYGKMSRDGCKTNWKIGWKITPIVQISSSHYFADTQHVMRRMEDMVDFSATRLYLLLCYPYTTHSIQFSGVTTAFSFTSYAVRNEEGN